VSGLNFDGQDDRLPEVQIAFPVEQPVALGFCKQKSRGWVAAPRPSTSSMSKDPELGIGMRASLLGPREQNSPLNCLSN
jgi:hypothetical protein